MKRYGLIGYPLSHSFSQSYFTKKFATLGLVEVVYENFPLTHIGELAAMLNQHPDLKGFNVTIPYKKEICALLSDATDAVKQMGACNCVKRKNGKLFGFNTDVVGFENSLRPFLQPHHTKALVLGSGGAAAAVYFVLQKLGIDYLTVSRKKTAAAITYDMINEKLVSEHPLIINTTPLGMYPHVESYPPIPYEYLTHGHHLYDLVYNPAETVFLQKGNAAGATTQNGAEMLVIQAEESWRIWNED